MVHYSQRQYYKDPVENEKFINIYGATLYCKHGQPSTHICYRCKHEKENLRYEKFMKSKFRYFDPFGNFFFGQKSPEDDEAVDVDDDFKIMGLSRSSSEEDLKKAYKKKALKTHPDKIGGDGSAFKKMKQAYENIKALFQGGEVSYQ